MQRPRQPLPREADAAPAATHDNYTNTTTTRDYFDATASNWNTSTHSALWRVTLYKDWQSTKSPPKVFWEECIIVPIGYNGEPQIHPKSRPFPFDNHHPI